MGARVGAQEQTLSSGLVGLVAHVSCATVSTCEGVFALFMWLLVSTHTCIGAMARQICWGVIHMKVILFGLGVMCSWMMLSEIVHKIFFAWVNEK